MKKCILVVIALLFSIFSVNIVFAAAFTQPDLTGTWRAHTLWTGSSYGWGHYTIATFSGDLIFVDCLGSTGETTCPENDYNWTIDPVTGVINETYDGDNNDNHYSMALNKTLIAGTQGPIGGLSQTLIVLQKVVPGTTYSPSDVQNKSFVYHELVVGPDYNGWNYGNGTTAADGAITMETETSPTGTITPGALGVTISVDANGIVTMSPGMDTYKGFLSADKKTIIGTFTDDYGSGDIRYRIMVIQITGQTYTAGSVPDHRAAVHMLVGGTTAPAPYWAHWNNNFTTGDGVSTRSDSVASNPAVTLSGAATANVSTSGVVTITEVPTFHAQISHDDTFSVGTCTIYDGTTPVGYALQVITKIPVTKNDINNDGISDMLWRNATTGQMTDWLMKSDGTRYGYKTIITNTDWTVVGTGLINRDGITDIVARQISTGQVSIWFMKSDGTRLSNRAVVTAPAWDVVGTGDFNTDGITDILVRAPSTGQVNIWFMNANGTRASSKAVLTSTAWDVVGTGDFNVDGVTDILARAPSTGQVNIWFMKSDGTRLSSKMVVTSTAWDVVGTGDFNGDGIIDILARASSTGQTNIWFMNADGSRKSSKMVITALDWTPVGTLDINADGISDIVAKSTTGKVNLWFMNGDGTRSSYKTLLDNPDWVPVP